MIVKYGTPLIDAVTNLQNCIYLNSTKAEYVALSE